MLDSSEFSEINDGSDEDTDYLEIVPIKRKKDEYITVRIPRSMITCPDVTIMQDRTGLSNRTDTGNICALLKACETVEGNPIDLNEFIVSTNRQARNKKRRESENDISGIPERSAIACCAAV